MHNAGRISELFQLDILLSSHHLDSIFLLYLFYVPHSSSSIFISLPHSLSPLHSSSLHPSTPPSQLASELGAHAVSHLENVSDTGIDAMAQAGVVGVLLPTTAYILRLHPPPARKMIEKGEIADSLDLSW